ncbi:MAG: pyruvate dehydrogenase, partial [Deltaproteobacteria bacterium]
MGRPGAHRIDTPTAEDLAVYQVIRDHVAKGALSMIDVANHKPANRNQKPKIGGHQASSMSAVDLLSALYLHALAPGDRLAVKPHAAPVVYALMHLFGVLSADAMTRLRELGGPQPYPTKLKSPLFVDYTTSSEGLGVAATIYDAYGALHHNRALADVGGRPLATTFFAHCGDGELTEGQIDESLYDAGRWRLNNLIWIVDLNRQSLDRVMDDSGRLERWVAGKFTGHGWQVRNLRWGARAEALFARAGGDALRAVLERLSDALYHPLTLIDGDAVRSALTGATAHEDPAVAGLLADYARRLPATAEERA